ncbi:MULTISPECIES: ABC transporter substrate-binding protein [Subtercola]|uniref:Carbohydrate ABC transporter substrate-binding protein n=1 Tax=Subtercola vilae TaxID=2056433 RepID=A0A4T2C941_9MICO|nr:MULTISPECIES: ABC transporter substrate-binding protein [Subtercola]MEA9983940.1 ABC transporter substrate-binding protein [Subtercola sp. RTI3]TIH40983.1 carbohydrate ABC transporter substrate-binding protein [Subtercola vilae]
MKTFRIGAAAAVLAVSTLVFAGCSSEPTANSGTVAGEVTLWSYGKVQPSMTKLIAGFEAANAGTTVNVIEEPGDQYFALLRAALTSGQGPDIFQMFPGGYQHQFSDYSLDLSKSIPRSEFEAVQGQYFAEKSNLDNPVYGVPLVSNMYYTLYNQAVLDKAGVTKFPTDWAEVDDACKKITAAGFLCIGYGSDTGAGGFDAYQDFSYMSGASIGLSGWDGLIDGSQKYDTPALVDQVTKWGALQTKGYTNPDVLTWRDVRTDFLAGKTAMYMTGSWDASWATDGLGTNVHAAPTPFSDSPMDVLVRLQDSGLSVSKDSKNTTTAAAFAAYAISQAGQQIIADAGGVPARTGINTDSAVNQEILANSVSQKWKVMPMMDNFLDASVTTALRSSLNQVMAGQLSAADALNKVDQATAAVSSSDRVTYNLSGK